MGGTVARMLSKIRLIIDEVRDEGLGAGIRSIAKYLIFHLRGRVRPNEKYFRVSIDDWHMYVDRHDSALGRPLAFYGKREKIESDLMKRQLHDGMVVLDIGANIGYYVLMEAHAVGDQGFIYAVEPFPNNVELLNRNIALNNVQDRVEVSQLAMSDQIGESLLEVGKTNNLHRLKSPTESETLPDSISEIKVKTSTVDEFLKNRRHVDLVRMDIEGFEGPVIDGMQGLLESDSPPIIVIEVHPTTYHLPGLDFGVRIHKLIELGYRAIAVVSAGTPQPEQFARMGYKPVFTRRESGFERGLYEDVRNDDLVELVMAVPKCTRSIVLKAGR